MLDRGYGAQIKGGGITDANEYFVWVVWGQKEEFPSFKAVTTSIPEIRSIQLVKHPNLLDRGHGAQIKGGGVTDANKHFVWVVWGQKEEFPSFRAVATSIPVIRPIRLG